jgi:hypothetical protein
LTTETSYLPAPEQLCLVKMSEMEVAHMIERHIDFVDENERPVQLPPNFVRSYMDYADKKLPVVVAVSHLPIVLADGRVLAIENGLDRDRGIIFRVPKELMRVLPKREDCTPAAVKQAFDFLMNEWLVDVAADFTGKCGIIAASLTPIERSLLPDRPTFFVSAGRRGGGKTTTLRMLVMAVLGMQAGAAAWSSNEEERRKAILAYFMGGLPYIIWDNIPRGTQISRPHIERSCTTAMYTDRKLGVSETVATAASTVHLFTGNNIAPKGDLASRSLCIRLELDRADPENREFQHPDPIGWTEAHRGQILAALYTLLLGNPALGTSIEAPAKTRFKVWWRMVGAAVEHAARLHGQPLDFGSLFLTQEEDEEESSSLADALNAMSLMWGDEFHASDVAKFINDDQQSAYPDEREYAQVLREFLFSHLPQGHTVSAKAVGNRLKRHVGEPVRHGEQTLILRATTDTHTKQTVYHVEVK